MLCIHVVCIFYLFIFLFLETIFCRIKNVCGVDVCECFAASTKMEQTQPQLEFHLRAFGGILNEAYLHAP